jgi:hypothetical protein
MSGSELVPIEEDEDLGPRVLKLRLQGQTSAQIAKELMIGKHQVHRALDAVLPVDSNYRRRAIAESLVTIDTLIAEHMKTAKNPDSASVVIRGVCERRALLGVGGSVDPVVLSQQSRPQEDYYAPYRRAIDAVRQRKIDKMTEMFDRIANEGKSGSKDASGACCDAEPAPASASTDRKTLQEPPDSSG